ncbi:MAG TPA: hypothetical protein VN281_12810, partial [Verrucomicrobiae bacterium]|nr:hypothetical protein [Verrucomicrobiae bacterium]
IRGRGERRVPAAPAAEHSAYLTPASGRQDHTTSPSARSRHRRKPPHPAAAFVKIAKRLSATFEGEFSSVTGRYAGKGAAR